MMSGNGVVRESGWRASERGEGRFGTMVGLCVLLLAIYLGFKVIPVMVNAYSFRDFIEQEARFAALKKADQEVSDRVLRKAEELELPVGPKDILVNRSATHFDITVKYTVPIKTPVYTYRWVFDEKSRAPLF
ncbi:MAG TPA: hypothetical protein VFG08_09255 [Candidatus Polarisedimenticolia bacterium]|nr:hypothetical protein [Candidatus Polarisedimenticolia bacterium]